MCNIEKMPKMEYVWLIEGDTLTRPGVIDWIYSASPACYRTSWIEDDEDGVENQRLSHEGACSPGPAQQVLITRDYVIVIAQ